MPRYYYEPWKYTPHSRRHCRGVPYPELIVPQPKHLFLPRSLAETLDEVVQETEEAKTYSDIVPEVPRNNRTSPIEMNIKKPETITPNLLGTKAVLKEVTTLSPELNSPGIDAESIHPTIFTATPNTTPPETTNASAITPSTKTGYDPFKHPKMNTTHPRQSYYNRQNPPPLRPPPPIPSPNLTNTPSPIEVLRAEIQSLLRDHIIEILTTYFVQHYPTFDAISFLAGLSDQDLELLAERVQRAEEHREQRRRLDDAVEELGCGTSTGGNDQGGIPEGESRVGENYESLKDWETVGLIQFLGREKYHRPSQLVSVERRPITI